MLLFFSLKRKEANLPVGRQEFKTEKPSAKIHFISLQQKNSLTFGDLKQILLFDSSFCEFFIAEVF